MPKKEAQARIALLVRQLVQVLEHVADVKESLAALGPRSAEIHHPHVLADNAARREQVVQLGVLQPGELTAFPVGRDWTPTIHLLARRLARFFDDKTFHNHGSFNPGFLSGMGTVVFPAQTWESVSQTWIHTRGEGEPRAQTGEKKAQKIFDRVQKTSPATNRWALKDTQTTRPPRVLGVGRSGALPPLKAENVVRHSRIIAIDQNFSHR